MRNFHVKAVYFNKPDGQHRKAWRVIAVGPRGGEKLIGTYYNENDALNLVQELRQAERGAIR